MFQYLGTFFYCYRCLLRIYAILFTIEMSLRFVAVGPRSLCRGEGGSMESDHLGGSMPHCFEPLNDQLRAGQSDKRHIGIGWIMPNRWVQIFDSDRATRDFTAVFTWARRKGRSYVTGNILECQDTTSCQLRYQIGCPTIRQIECHVYIECQKWYTLNGRKSCTSWHG